MPSATLRRRLTRNRLPGGRRTDFATPPSVHYHAHSQAGVAIKSAGQVISCPDLMGLADLSGFASDGTTVVGPIEMTDGLGRKFWRFNGTQWAWINNTLTGLANRQMTTMAVVRVHHAATCQIVAPRFATYTNDTTNTAASTVFGMLKGVVTTNSGICVQGSTPAVNGATDAYKVIAGAQLHVAGVAQRTTANGGNRSYVNNDTCDVGQSTTSQTGYVGALLGAASAGANNAATVSTGSANSFDLYEVAIWKGELSNAQAAAAAAALVSNYAIPQLDSQLLLDGDSITYGIATTLGTSPANCGGLATQLTDPGAGLIPGNVRVVNLGTSGSVTSGVVTRRDTTNAMSTYVYPGGASKNVVVVQLGRNDCSESSGKKNSATFYADMVAIFNTTTTGYLQRGWRGVCVANIACTPTAVTTNVSPAGENTVQKRLEAFRLLIAVEATHLPQSQFLIDTLSDPGNTFDGLMSVLHLYDISQGGNKWFYDAVQASDEANAAPPGPYDSDATHPVAAGVGLMATGGDTPQFGYGSIL